MRLNINSFMNTSESQASIHRLLVAIRHVMGPMMLYPFITGRKDRYIRSDDNVFGMSGFWCRQWHLITFKQVQEGMPLDEFIRPLKVIKKNHLTVTEKQFGG